MNIDLPMVFPSCNICGSSKYREICDIKISPILTPSKLVKCKECGFFYAAPRLKKEAEEDYYRNCYHEIEGWNFWYERRIDVFKRLLHEIGKFLKKGKLIDVGCGMGHFMDLARTNGWEVKGVEISASAVEYAKKKVVLDVIKGSLKDAQFETESFDVATMWNVLDQIYEPKANLIEINRILKKGGYIFIRVPNLYFHLKLLSLYDRLRIVFRNIGDAPVVFHLYSFDKNSIEKILESTGFSNIIVNTEHISQPIIYFTNIFGRIGDRLLRKLLDFGTGFLYFVTLRKFIISPSIFVIAQKSLLSYCAKNNRDI